MVPIARTPGNRVRSVPDLERTLGGGDLVGDRDPGDGCARRTLIAPRQQLIDLIPRSLRHHLDRAVGTVANPPSHTELSGLGPTTVPIEHALDTTLHDRSDSDGAHGAQERW